MNSFTAVVVTTSVLLAIVALLLWAATGENPITMITRSGWTECDYATHEFNTGDATFAEALWVDTACGQEQLELEKENWLYEFALMVGEDDCWIYDLHTVRCATDSLLTDYDNLDIPPEYTDW